MERYYPKKVKCTDCDWRPDNNKMPYAFQLALQHGVENDHAVNIVWGKPQKKDDC